MSPSITRPPNSPGISRDTSGGDTNIIIRLSRSPTKEAVTKAPTTSTPLTMLPMSMIRNVARSMPSPKRLLVAPFVQLKNPVMLEVFVGKDRFATRNMNSIILYTEYEQGAQYPKHHQADHEPIRCSLGEGCGYAYDCELERSEVYEAREYAW